MAAITAVFDFRSRLSSISDRNGFVLFLIYKSPLHLSFLYFLSSFESSGISFQRKKLKIFFFQNGAMVAILDFRSERLTILMYKLPSYPVSIGLSVQVKLKNNFQNGECGGYLGFSIGTILAIFDWHLILIVLIKFCVNWPFGSGEVKNIFQDGRRGDHHRFPMWTIVIICGLQSISKFPTKFRENLPLRTGEVQNSFSRWLPWMSLATFDLKAFLILPTKFQVSCLRGVRADTI